jgi:hypothetical protein
MGILGFFGGGSLLPKGLRGGVYLVMDMLTASRESIVVPVQRKTFHAIAVIPAICSGASACCVLPVSDERVPFRHVLLVQFR